MQSLLDFSAAFLLFFRSFAFIRRYSLGSYLLWPLLCSLLCLIIVIWGSYAGLFQLIDSLILWLFGYEAQASGSWLSFFISTLALSSSVVLALLLYRFLASIIIIPFLGPLLSRIEKIIIGQSIELSIKQDLLNAVYGMGTALRAALYSLGILIFSFFTGPLQIPINFIAQSYFMGRGSFDYIFEKAGPDLNQRKELIQKNRYAILGNGCAYLIFFFLPILGFLLGPILALTGAARWYYEKGLKTKSKDKEWEPLNRWYYREKTKETTQNTSDISA